MNPASTRCLRRTDQEMREMESEFQMVDEIYQVVTSDSKPLLVVIEKGAIAVPLLKGLERQDNRSMIEL